jgi:hypothetical protein
MNHARAKLKEVQAVAARNPAASFIYETQPALLDEHVQRFADTVADAERYAHDRKR